jgi:hypothetical protein
LINFELTKAINMKTVILIFILSLMGLNSATGQSYYKKQWARKNTATLSTGFTSMRSTRGWERGFELTYGVPKKIQIGVFSYKGNTATETSLNNYQGVLVDLPLLMIYDKVSLGVNGRLGLHNKRFISFLPMLQLLYDLNERISVKSSVGVSERLPVFAFKLNFRLTNPLK